MDDELKHHLEGRDDNWDFDLILRVVADDVELFVLLAADELVLLSLEFSVPRQRRCSEPLRDRQLELDPVGIE